jgi:uncharacterized protein YcsI (UPF0317 family)
MAVFSPTPCFVLNAKEVGNAHHLRLKDKEEVDVFLKMDIPRR